MKDLDENSFNYEFPFICIIQIMNSITRDCYDTNIIKLYFFIKHLDYLLIYVLYYSHYFNIFDIVLLFHL